MSQISLLDIFLRDPLPLVWLAIRNDGKTGSGTLNDPYDTTTASRFDALMKAMPANAQIHLGPGLFQSAGFTDGAPTAGWQAKPGQKIIGSGIDVTRLQIVPANPIPDVHYFAVGATAGTFLDFFEISDLTIDCNNPAFAQSACGAIRVMGNHCRIRRTKAINFGTKTNATGCFVLSFIVADASASVNAETVDSGIEDCLALQPSFENRREVTIFHIGGIENAANHVQGYGKSPYLRNNFVDCTSSVFLTPPPSVPDESKAGTLPILTAQAVSIDSGTHRGTLTFNRAHHWTKDLPGGRYVQISNPNNPTNPWNGYFLVTSDKTSFSPSLLTYKLEVDLLSVPVAPTSSDDASLLIAGTEFRAISVSSCRGGIVEGNQLHNCWIGGPHFDQLNTKELIVRNNTYKNVVAG